MKHSILCVDDEIDNLEALERVFRTKFHVLKATSGKQALDLLDQHPEPIAVIITDQRMPQMTGVEFLSQSMKTHPNSLRILLTGYTDMESVISAINKGQIYRYLNKPWDSVDLLHTVEKAAERFDLQNELKTKNEELARALTELRTLDQAKNQFMILINHELKTPLTSIVSFAELLRESKLNAEQSQYLSRIQKSTDRLQELVNDVLYIVGAETKTLKTQKQQVNLASILEQAEKNLSDVLHKKNISLKVEIPAGKKLVADESMLKQVLLRILHNAGKYGRENSVVELKASLPQPHRMQLTIFNEGPQISPAVIDKILKPFFLDEDVMNHSVGMGLGLTICQSLLKLHQSELQIRNRGAGVEVGFSLPCI